MHEISNISTDRNLLPPKSDFSANHTAPVEIVSSFEQSGCWGVITHVGDYSCTLETWDAEYTVKTEHLKSLELSDNDCQFMQQLCVRLRRLHQIENRDSAVDWLCLGLGKQLKPYLSPLQEKLLADVEQEYGLL
jgi:hypothetical protein